MVRDVALSVRSTLLDVYKPPGIYDVRWPGPADDGSPVTAGLYWAVLETPDAAMARLVFVDQDVPAPPVSVYGWTISSSPTDPFVNGDPTPTSGLLTLYLWLACSDGLAGAEFRLDGTLALLALQPMNGFLNGGTGSDALLGVAGSPSAPVVAASILVLDSGAGGTMCLAPAASTGRNVSLAAADFIPWPNDYIGYSNDGSAPCAFWGEAAGFCADR